MRMRCSRGFLTPVDAGPSKLDRGSTASGIVSAALALLEKNGGGGGAAAEVEELVSQDVFDTSCSGKRICIIAFLKDILDEYVLCVRVAIPGGFVFRGPLTALFDCAPYACCVLFCLPFREQWQGWS
jgi:hypothetical protein